MDVCTSFDNCSGIDCVALEKAMARDEYRGNGSRGDDATKRRKSATGNSCELDEKSANGSGGTAYAVYQNCTDFDGGICSLVWSGSRSSG